MKVAYLENSPFRAISEAIADSRLILPKNPPKIRTDNLKASKVNDSISKLVDLNYKRRKIRLPWLYSNQFSAFIYKTNKRKHVARLYSYYYQKLNEFNPDVLLVWNGSLLPGSILKLAALNLGIQITHFENGFFPDTIQIDNNGINGFNSVPKDIDFYMNLDSSYNKAFISELNVRVQKNTHTVSQDQIPFTNYVFVPMQVPSDMQVIELSPWVKDMYHLYSILHAIVELYPNVKFVIKEHPSFKLSIQKKIKQHPNIAFANAALTETLINKSDAVLTINSTVGLEAISKNKPLITLGTAYYNIEGLATNCDSLESLIAVFKELDFKTPNVELRNRFLNLVKDTYLISGSLKSQNDILLTDIKNRILKNDEYYKIIKGLV